MLKPAASTGDTEYDTTGPPLLVGAFGAMGRPLMYVTGLVEYVRSLGGTGATH
jgi:hypothetical protein